MRIRRGVRLHWLPRDVARRLGLPEAEIERVYMEIEHQIDEARRMRERAAHERFLTALRRGSAP
jgi:hypothetical protein